MLRKNFLESKIAPPAPSQIGGVGSTPEIIVRPPGWFSNDENFEDYNSEECEESNFGKVLSMLGMDIDPLYIILGGGGVATLLLGICIVAMLRRHLREKELAAKQEHFKATGPVFRFVEKKCDKFSSSSFLLSSFRPAKDMSST